MDYTFDANSDSPNEVVYLKNAQGDEFYPRKGSDLVLEGRYAKTSNGSQIYPKDASGKEFLFRGVYARDNQLRPFYPKDKDQSEYGENAYISRDYADVYPKDSTGAMMAINNKYGRDEDLNESYPRDREGNEYIVGNKYAKTSALDEFYPKKSNGAELFISGTYARNSNQNEIYPRNKYGHEIAIHNLYAKNSSGDEIYPWLSGKKIEYALNNRYAKTSQGGAKSYPKYKDDEITDLAHLVIAPDKRDPQFIIPNQWFFLHREFKVFLNDSKYIIKKTDNAGDLYIAVMTGQDQNLYSAWKAKDPQLPSQFKRVSLKKYKDEHDIYKKENGDLFIFVAGNIALVDFDEKNQLHTYVRGRNNKKIYYITDKKNNKLHYENPKKKLYQDIFLINPVISNLGEKPVYYEMDGSDMQLYTLDNNVRLNGKRLSNFSIEKQDMDRDGNIYCKTTDGDYCWYETDYDEMVCFDFVNKRKEKKRYTRANSNKSYFEWDSQGQKKGIPIPTGPLNDEPDIEENVLSKPWGYFYIYIVVILAFIVIVFFHWILYMSLPSNRPDRDNFISV